MSATGSTVDSDNNVHQSTIFPSPTIVSTSIYEFPLPSDANSTAVKMHSLLRVPKRVGVAVVISRPARRPRAAPHPRRDCRSSNRFCNARIMCRREERAIAIEGVGDRVGEARSEEERGRRGRAPQSQLHDRSIIQLIAAGTLRLDKVHAVESSCVASN